MAYIKKEPVIEFITKGLNNPDKSKAYGYDAIEILTEIEYADTYSEDEILEYGAWIPYELEESYGNEHSHTWYKCSICSKAALGRCYEDEWYSYPLRTEFCPHCGKKMINGSTLEYMEVKVTPTEPYLSKACAVDFDGTLCEVAFPGIGNPRKNVISFVKNLKEYGWKLILWTNREGTLLEEAVAWCKEHGLEFDAVNENLSDRTAHFGNDCRKIGADLYIDDKSIHPDDLN